MSGMGPIDPARFGRAAALAAEFHAGQTRKGTDTSYLSHLLAVAALAAEDGADEDTLMAALLHDAAEDQGGEAVLQRIVDELGPKVGRIVRECSDALPGVGERKRPWRERKEQMIASVVSLSSDACLVIAADKLHNARATRTDVEVVGTTVWSRFKTGRDGFVWYHEQMLAALERRAPWSRSVHLLRQELEAIRHQAVDGDGGTFTHPRNI